MSTKVLPISESGKLIANAANFGTGRAANQQSDHAPATEPKRSPFIAKTAAQWVLDEQNKPVPKSLFGPLVIEHELTVCFASTNIGKSILAVQIAQTIASGEGSEPFTTHGTGRKVLYIDFELNARQFTRRYSQDNGQNFFNPYKFHDNFLRLESECPEPEKGQDMSEYYLQSITQAVDEHAAHVLIIDNISWIALNLEKGADAGELMKGLDRLKKDKKITIIVLAHTPKRDQTTPIDIKDIAGSAKIGNFIDAAFAIGRSQQDGMMRYIKQVKARSGEIVFGAENVAVCTLEKNGNFLGFQFRHYEDERAHLHQRSEADTSERDEKVMEMHRAGKSYRAIADELGMGKSTVERIAKKGSPLLIDNPAFADDDEPLF